MPKGTKKIKLRKINILGLRATIVNKTYLYSKTSKMKANRFFSLVLLTSVLFSSCERHRTQTVIGSGDVQTEEIQATDFTGVTVTGTCSVTITIGETFSVKLHAQQQVLNVMTTRVKNGVLEIGFDPDYSVNTDKEISATIVLPLLDYVSITGAGNFSLSGEKQARLNIVITGAGNIEAFAMEVDDCTININGSGNCKVNVIETLVVNVSGVGNVFYKGSPEITSYIGGVGNVIAAGR
jgi:hypothetical protein